MAATAPWAESFTRPRHVWPQCAPSFSSTKQTSAGKPCRFCWAHKHIDSLCTGLVLSWEAQTNMRLVSVYPLHELICFSKLRSEMKQPISFFKRRLIFLFFSNWSFKTLFSYFSTQLHTQQLLNGERIHTHIWCEAPQRKHEWGETCGDVIIFPGNYLTWHTMVIFICLIICRYYL